MEAVHTPVMLKECLEWLDPRGEPYAESAFMIDSTLGEGGHTLAFLSSYKKLSILGIDADSSVLLRAKKRLSAFGGRVRFFNGWFDDFFRLYPSDIPVPNLILFDLGISMYHYVESGRGFSFQKDEMLDMRLNAKSGQTASDIVNTMPETSLADILYSYADERYSRMIAAAIVRERQHGNIVSSKNLADIIYKAVPPCYRHGRIHPATRTFQALRIAVNGELRRLPHALYTAFNALGINGKMGVITFHSLEDRIVKHFFRNLGKRCVCPPNYPSCLCGGTSCAKVLTNKAIVPTENEVANNPPSRSAKFRVVRKLRNATKLHIVDILEKGVI